MEVKVQIRAAHKRGILNVEIPKPEEKKPKKITMHCVSWAWPAWANPLGFF
jgi:hypothetical protein